MMLKPVAVADPKDIDWEGSWKSYGEIFDGNAAEVKQLKSIGKTQNSNRIKIKDEIFFVYHVKSYQVNT